VSVRSTVARQVNNVIRPLKIQVVPGYSADSAVKTFIPAHKTIAQARKLGLSVGAYVDQKNARPGASPEAVRAMLDIAGLTGKCEVVCEIGPGTGRYAEAVIEALHPNAYEIYETAKDWMPTLRRLPNAVVRDCDGRTLSQTADASVDLVHAQKVFVYTEFFASAGYLDEMARVVRPSGIVAFDVVTEPCLDEQTVMTWIEDRTIYRPFPREWTIDFMQRRGLKLCGSHFVPLPPGTSELLVFRRDQELPTG
jgi:SAM-dependent methyltransferase